MSDDSKMMDESSKEIIYVASDNGEVDEWGQNSSVERRGTSHSEYEDYDCDYNSEEKISLKSGGSQENSKKKYIQSEMLSYKQQGSYDIPEDVYAFITVAPVCSMPFIFAVMVIMIKYVVYVTLFLEQRKLDDLNSEQLVSKIVKFFLIPVTVAMQEDLMAVYAGLANARYDPKVLEISASATKWKFALAYLLQLIDGLLSLIVNFAKMLTTKDILDVFLNFAALHFLQDIDDVFYALVEKGFFGDDMEHMATVCKQISWPRRAGTTKFSQFLTNLDSLLFGVTFLVCLACFFINIFYF